MRRTQTACSSFDLSKADAASQTCTHALEKKSKYPFNDGRGRTSSSKAGGWTAPKTIVGGNDGNGAIQRHSCGRDSGAARPVAGHTICLDADRTAVARRHVRALRSVHDGLYRARPD